MEMNLIVNNNDYEKEKLWYDDRRIKDILLILTYATVKGLAANITFINQQMEQQRGVNVVLFMDDFKVHQNRKLTKLLQSYDGVFLNLNPLSAFKIYVWEFFQRHHEKMVVAYHKAIFGTSKHRIIIEDINTYTDRRHLSYNLEKHFMYLASLYKIQLNPHKLAPNEELLYTFRAMNRGSKSRNNPTKEINLFIDMVYSQKSQSL